MYPVYHRAITAKALGGYFSPPALEMVIAANLGQDHLLRGQIGHPEYHFDQNALQQSWAYIERNRLLVRPALETGKAAPARSALGRLTHAAQDLYAHSNYVPLWLSRFPEGKAPPADEIDPFDSGLLQGSELRSGKLYYPFELLSFVPFLGAFARLFLPHDSHARMNLDAPQRGRLFAYAFAAAVKRTVYEYDLTIRGLPPQLLSLFHG
jgi:hypothetical protein